MPELPDFAALERLGWDAERTSEYRVLAAPGDLPARIARVYRGGWVDALVGTEQVRARKHPRFRRLMDPLEAPVVGDWAVLRPDPAGGPTLLERLLSRRTALVRTAGDADESRTQVMAANVDVVLIVVPIDVAVNVRRLDRLLSLAHSSGAHPVVVLSKADACANPQAIADDLADEVGGAGLVWLSARSGVGLERLRPYLRPGSTLVLIGASGGGKSTLANALAGRELLETGEVRADGRGRHTTTHRQLVELPSGALLIDTPGLRSIGTWTGEDEEPEAALFSDVEEIAAACRFSDCTHNGEPDCAIAEALESGLLTAERWERYLKLQADREERERRRQAMERAAETRRARARRGRR